MTPGFRNERRFRSRRLENTKRYYTPKNRVKALIFKQLRAIGRSGDAGRPFGIRYPGMRVLVDYRPALRARTGVGEWVHNLARALLRLPEDAGAVRPAITLFVSSWKDRPSADARVDLPGATFVDRRVPVRVLTWAWNRLSWPPVEMLTGSRYDVAFSPTPLLVPSRARLRTVTVHDLDFLEHPERTWGEMRRDYPMMVTQHVRQADVVVTISHFTASEATRRLGIPRERMIVCRPGVPDWIAQPLAAQLPPAFGQPPRERSSGGYILFVGTLEARKNVAGLLESYQRLRAMWAEAPPLVLAGGVPPGTEAWLRDALAGPLGHGVTARGYMRPEDRPAVYAGAALLVLPSYMEGFGIPVLEAMALGVPVIVSSRGALPEVAGDAGVVLDPDDHGAWAEAMAGVLRSPGRAAGMRARGAAQAARFRWDDAARTLRDTLAARLADGGRVAPRAGGA